MKIYFFFLPNQKVGIYLKYQTTDSFSKLVKTWYRLDAFKNFTEQQRAPVTFGNEGQRQAFLRKIVNDLLK